MIGNLHVSHGSGKIHNFKVVEVDYRNIVFATTLALSALVNSMQDAAYLFGFRKKKTSEGFINKKLYESSKEAYAFLSGTGLEMMIEYYQIDYDAEELREKFGQIFKTTS